MSYGNQTIAELYENLLRTWTSSELDALARQEDQLVIMNAALCSRCAMPVPLGKTVCEPLCSDNITSILPYRTTSYGRVLKPTRPYVPPLPAPRRPSVRRPREEELLLMERNEEVEQQRRRIRNLEAELYNRDLAMEALKRENNDQHIRIGDLEFGERVLTNAREDAEAKVEALEQELAVSKEMNNMVQSTLQATREQFKEQDTLLKETMSKLSSQNIVRLYLTNMLKKGLEVAERHNK